MGRNCGYQRYCGFHWTPHELRYGMGLTCCGLRCTWVRVWCGKTQPMVYPCGTLYVDDELANFRKLVQEGSLSASDADSQMTEYVLTHLINSCLLI